MPDKKVMYRIKLEGKEYLIAPVKPGGSSELLLKLDGELSVEQQKAKQCADWFMETEEWFDSLSASVNLRANLHKCFDTLFWGKETEMVGGRPADTPDKIRKRFLEGEKVTLPESQYGVLGRVLKRKDGETGMNSREYFDYLMYGAEDDEEWPGFIHWFRMKPKEGKTVTQLNKNPKFREGPVSEPGTCLEYTRNCVNPKPIQGTSQRDFL